MTDLAPNETLAPGIYADVPMDEYLRLPGASSHRLRLMRDKSPLHVRWEMDHPSPTTDAFRVGTAVHMAILEPRKFAARYVCGPDGHWGRHPAKGELDALREEHPGKVILKPDEWQVCHTLRKRVAEHPKAKRLLDGKSEMTMVWNDPETGVLCRGRADHLSDRSPAIVDLKTTRDAAPDRFARDAYSYGYYLQGGLYQIGAQEVGYDAQHFIVVAIEKEPPFGIAVYRLEDDDLAWGAEEARDLLREWKRCEETGVWPGYSDRVEPLPLPSWGVKQIEQRMEGRK